MSSYPRWKYFIVLLVLLTSFVYTLPNFYQSKPAIEINLNDQIKVSEIINELDQPQDSIINKAKKIIFTYDDSESQLISYDKLRNLNLNTTYSLTNYINLPSWLKYINAYPMYLGLDLKGGVHFLLQVDKDNMPTLNTVQEPRIRVQKWNAETGQFVTTSGASRSGKGKNSIQALAAQAYVLQQGLDKNKKKPGKSLKQSRMKYGW